MHFWLYQLAVPVMVLAVAALYLGVEAADPVAGLASAIFSARNGKAAMTPQ